MSLKTEHFTSCLLIREIPATLDCPGLFRNRAERDSIMFQNIRSDLDEKAAADPDVSCR